MFPKGSQTRNHLKQNAIRYGDFNTNDLAAFVRSHEDKGIGDRSQIRLAVLNRAGA